MSINIRGLDQLQRQMNEAAEAFRLIDGEITTVRVNPGDPTSIEVAIAEMEHAIDSKLAIFSKNPLVQQLAANLKTKYKDQILERAMDAKTTGAGQQGNATPEQTVFRQIENTVTDLRRSDSNGFERHIEKLSRLLHSPSLEAISSELKKSVDAETVLKAGYATEGSMVGSAKLPWPSDVTEELGLVIQLIDRFAEQPNEAFQISHTFFYAGNSTTGTLRNMVEQMIVPFARDYIGYVKERTGTKEATLLIERIEPAARKAFVVHGHDEGARESVARFLELIGFDAIILHEQANQGRTVIEKIEAHGDVGFAVVLLTPDDEGAAKGETPQPRARQNVLLELGYFIGRLGRSRVCALKRGDVEIPSDFAGVVYEPFDNGNGWKTALARELQGAGFDIDWNRIFKR